MSRVFDLLDNVKNRPDAKDIHPALKEAVFASREQDTSHRRYLLLALIAVSSIIVGAGLKYYLEVMKPGQHAVSQQLQKGLPLLTKAGLTVNKAASLATEPSPQTVSISSVAAIPSIESAKAIVRVAQPLVTQPPASNRPLKTLQQKAVKLPAGVDRPAPVALAKINEPKSREETTRLSANDASMKDRYLLLAREMESKRDYEQALKYCRQALELTPDNYRLLNNIAGLSLQAGHVKEASVAAQRALKLKRGFLPALINLGIAEARQGNAQQAMVSFVRAFSLDPANRVVLYNIALLQERSGNLDESAEYYRRLSEAGDLKGALGLGRIMEKQQKWREAITVYREILASTNLTPQERGTTEDRLAKLAP